MLRFGQYANIPAASRFRREGGVSFLELLIVIGILAVISVVAGVSWVGYQREQALSAATRDVLSLLGEARGNAIARKDLNTDDNANWGVRVVNVNGASSFVELFEGADYGSGTVMRHFTFSDRVDLTEPIGGATKDMIFEPRTGKLTVATAQDDCDTGTDNCALIQIISLSDPGLFYDIAVFQHGGIRLQ